MQTKTKSLIWVIAAALVCCGVMALVDGVIQPGYAAKSAIKIVIFALIPAALTVLCKLTSLKEILVFRKKGVLLALGLGVAIYGIILAAYFIARPYFDFSKVAGSLTKSAGVTKDNFLFVSLYISFANSLLEEFFFRGFLFTNLKRSSGAAVAYGISALAFGLYHVAMMIGWFGFWLNALVMLGLLAGGVIFNWLNEKLGCIYASWLTHMFANFAINTIGFILLNT